MQHPVEGAQAPSPQVVKSKYIGKKIREKLMKLLQPDNDKIINISVTTVAALDVFEFFVHNLNITSASQLYILP